MSPDVNIAEQLKLLVELQGLDSQIMKLTQEIEAIPVKIQELDAAFTEKTQNLKKAEENARALQVKKKEREGALETGEGTVKKYQGQLGQLKTNKEYSALLEEISRVKADDSLIEETIIKLMDEIDAANARIAKEKELLKAEEGKLADEKKRLNDERARLSGEAETHKKARAALAAKVDPKILTRYERLLENRDGLAIVGIVNDSCQGCYRVLPPQVVNEVRMKASLIVCESCARILYVED